MVELKVKKEGSEDAVTTKELIINVRGIIENLFMLAFIPLTIYGVMTFISAQYIGWYALFVALVPSTIIIIKYLDWLEKRLK